MPRTPRPLPPSLDEHFSYGAARAAGATARRLRHPSLDALYHGARSRPRAEEPADDDETTLAAEARRLRAEIARHAAAVAAIAPDHWFFSHVTAAVLWGLPVPIRLLRSVLHDVKRGRTLRTARGIDVAVMAPGRPSKAQGIRGRQLRPALASVRVVDGLRVSSPASTWAMLAGDLDVAELVELGDAIVRIPRRRGMERGDPADALGSIEQLVSAASAPYRRHAEKLQEAVALVRVGSASPAETRIRLACRHLGLPEPELDVDVYDRDGHPIGFTEIAFAAFRVLVEYEGDHHRTDRRQWYRDIDKHTACVAAGWHVLRLASTHAYPRAEPAAILIREALLRAGWRP